MLPLVQIPAGPAPTPLIDPTTVAIAINTLNVIVLTVTAVLLYRQHKSTHDWYRRKAAHDLTFEASLGRFRMLRAALERKINIHDRNQTELTVRATLVLDDYIEIDAVLNFLENTCLAIKNNVIDEQIVYDAIGDVMISYFRWAEPYVTESRRSISQQLWIETDPYLRRWKKWTQKTEEEIEAARTKAIAPGHPRI